MSTWKRVLTTDDVVAPDNTNLSNANLTSNSTQRTFTLPASTASSSLLFRGVGGDGVTKTSLRIETDSDTNQQDQNYVYANSFRIGNFDLSGTSSHCGYSLPQHENFGAGKIIVTESSTDLLGSTSFKTLDQWLDPDNSGNGFDSTSLFDATGSQPRSDKLLVWDDDSSKYKASSIEEVSKAMGRCYTFSFGRGSSVATSGDVKLRTTNGAEDTGYVVPIKSRIIGITYAGRFFNTDGTGQVKVKLKLDGVAAWTSDGGQNYQSYQAVFLGDYGNDTHSAVKLFSTPIEINQGTRVDVFVNFTGDTGGDVDDQSALVWIDTYDSHSLPATI